MNAGLPHGSGQSAIKLPVHEAAAGGNLEIHPPILVVDDRADKQLAIGATLAELQHRVVFAESAMEALRRLLRENFCVILLDMNLPEMDGIELARIIRSRRRSAKTPIIFYTADGDTAMRRLTEAYQLGGVDLLIAPVPGEVLRAKVAVFADFHRRLSEERRIAGERERLLRAEAARAEAERASAAKDRFIAMLSHELRTPLSPVLNTIELLLDSPNHSPELREQLEVIQRNVVLEARLIDDLLDLTKVSRGKMSLRLEPVDLADSLKGVLQICQAEMEGKQIAIKLSAAEPKSVVRADSARLKQILWNLIRNAIKHTAPHGTIHVSIFEAEHERLCMQVADEGAGISPELLPKIFDAFHQGAHSVGGLGLGLAITRAIVELHGGTIEARSDGLGRGATFSVFLPRAGNTAPAVPAETADARTLASVPLPARLGARLLLVEDHPDSRHTLERLLHRRGYSVETAHDVRSALAIADTERFDVIISDIGLPDGTGYDFISRVRAENRVKAIALSGYGMEADIARSADAGFARHLVKPVNLDELDATIQSLILKVL